MKILLLGCGYIGPATAHYLLKQPEVKKLTLLDSTKSQLLKTAKQLSTLPNKQKFEMLTLDVNQQDPLISIMNRHDIIAATLPWSATLRAITAATQTSKPFISITRPHYPDLEVLTSYINHQSSLIMLGCGLEPGLTEILARHAIEHFVSIETLQILCGGIPRNPCPPLNYKSVFNSIGLPTTSRTIYTIKNGKLYTVPRFSGIESVNIENIGTLEAWHDGMLPWLIDLPGLKQAKTVSQKTLRWPGFASTIQLLTDLGFLTSSPIALNNHSIIPYKLTRTILNTHTQFATNDRDVSILQVEAWGVHNHHKKRYQSILIDHYDEAQQMTAMARTAGFTLAIITMLIGSGEIKACGLVRPEEIFIHDHYHKLIASLKETQITIKENWSSYFEF